MIAPDRFEGVAIAFEEFIVSVKTAMDKCMCEARKVYKNDGEPYGEGDDNMLEWFKDRSIELKRKREAEEEEWYRSMLQRLAEKEREQA